jgi:glycosyltransferase involved in cell wall biosynthesis
MAEGSAFEYQHYANSNLAAALLEREQFDIVHVHLGCETLPFGKTIGLNRAVYTLHAPFSPDDIWCLEQHPEIAVVGISAFQVSPVGNRPHLHVIHNGCDFDRYKVSSRADRSLLFLGRLSPQKSPLHAIQIAQAADYPLVIAGGPQNAEEERYFDSEIRSLINGNNIRYVGPVMHDQKVELLSQATALLFPIQGDEAFGMVMIESMACGTPVVAWDRASVREIVDFGKTGFYGTSVTGLASCVHEAARLDRRSVAEYARAKFDSAVMSTRYESLYQSVRAR